jgi:hypothetical protein
MNADRKQEDDDLKNNVNVLKRHALSSFDTTMQARLHPKIGHLLRVEFLAGNTSNKLLVPLVWKS